MATYGSANGVQAIVPAAGEFAADSTPTVDQVTIWLAEGHSEINRYLSAAGYVTPASAGAQVYPSLTALNDLYAAAYVLRARGLDITQGREENRSGIMLKDFFKRLEALVAQDLTALGLSLRPPENLKRRRVRSLQLRRVDGYSGRYGSMTTGYGNPSD